MSEGTIFPREKCPGGDKIKGDNIYYDTGSLSDLFHTLRT